MLSFDDRVERNAGPVLERLLIQHKKAMCAIRVHELLAFIAAIDADWCNPNLFLAEKYFYHIVLVNFYPGFYLRLQ
jgi:hypothetical protein